MNFFKELEYIELECPLCANLIHVDIKKNKGRVVDESICECGYRFLEEGMFSFV